MSYCHICFIPGGYSLPFGWDFFLTLEHQFWASCGWSFQSSRSFLPSGIWQSYWSHGPFRSIIYLLKLMKRYISQTVELPESFLGLRNQVTKYQMFFFTKIMRWSMDFLTNMPHYAKHPSSSKAWLVSRLTTKLRKQKLRKPRHVPPAKTWELESPSNRCWCSPIPLPHSPLHGYRYRLPSTDSDRRDPPLRNTWVFLVMVTKAFEGEQKSLGLPLFLHILKENYH